MLHEIKTLFSNLENWVKYLHVCFSKSKHFKIMKKVLLMLTIVSGLFAGTTYAQEKKNPMVGGAPMYENKDIIDNAVNSKDHTTLVAAIKAAELVETLKSDGPFTVFAPTNKAFDKLPAGTVDGLLKPESKETLTKVLTYHVVSGKMDSKAIAASIKAGNGKATFNTVSGNTLTASMEGSKLKLTDENGGKSYVTVADVYQSNGVIHVVDGVLLPK